MQPLKINSQIHKGEPTMRLALILTAIIITSGCGCDKSKKEKLQPPKQKSTLNTVIEGATGKTAVDAGNKAKAQIEAISEKRNKDLNDIMGE